MKEERSKARKDMGKERNKRQIKPERENWGEEWKRECREREGLRGEGNKKEW